MFQTYWKLFRQVATRSLFSRDCQNFHFQLRWVVGTLDLGLPFRFELPYFNCRYRGSVQQAPSAQRIAPRSPSSLLAPPNLEYLSLSVVYLFEHVRHSASNGQRRKTCFWRSSHHIQHSKRKGTETFFIILPAPLSYKSRKTTVKN